MNTDEQPVLRYSPKYRAWFFVMKDKTYAPLAKQAGFGWHKGVNHWFTYELRTAEKLLEYADTAALTELNARLDKLHRSYSDGTGLGEPLYSNSGKESLPFQNAGIHIGGELPVFLLADEQGLGKTIQAIGIARFIIAQKGAAARVLIISTASIKLNWKREFAEWGQPDVKIQVLQGSRSCVIGDAQVVVVNYDLLTKLYDELARPWDVVIGDEAHYLKNMKSKRTRAVLGYREQKGLAKQAEKTVFLTGTPVLNRPIELWPILSKLAPDTIYPYVSYLDFGRRYCAGYQGGFGWDMSGSSREEELNVRLRSTIMVRRLKKDVQKQLPPKQYQVIPLEPSKEARKIIRQEGSLKLTDAKKQSLKGFDAGELAELRHKLAMAKLPICVQHIEDLLLSLDKVVVFAYHTAVLKGLYQALEKYEPVLLDGSTPAGRRQDLVDTFQNEADCRVFLGQLQAAGTGITLTAASTVVFVESSWVPGEIAQAVDRCHRIGQKDSVLAHFLVVQGSLEEYMLRTIVDKQRTINRILK